MTLLTADQFEKLCEDLYRDRHQIYEFNPTAPHSEVLLWTLLGSLYSLLDLNEREIALVDDRESGPAVGTSEPGPSSLTEKYIDAICRALDQHRLGQYDPGAVLNRLIDKIQLD